MALIAAGGVCVSLVSRPETGVPWSAFAIIGAFLAWAIVNNLTCKGSARDPVPIAMHKGLVAGSVNTALAFAGFLHQAKQRGCAVERFNLTQQPVAFLENEAVKAVLDGEGVDALPVIIVDGQVVLKGRYPDEAQRTAWLNNTDSTP